jgi:hypothetical protein
VIRGLGRIGVSGGSGLSGGSGMSGAGGMSGGGTMSGSTTTTRSTSAGLGDVIASAGYSVYSTDSTSFNLVGKVKFGTANANKGLGTGQTDYSAQIDTFHSIDDDVMVFATLGYSINGSPSGISLRNTPYGAVGASRKLGADTTMGARFDMAKNPLAAGDNLKQASVYLSHHPAADIDVTVKALKGFSDADPDYGIGIYVSRIY